jgi:hypothetical protein
MFPPKTKIKAEVAHNSFLSAACGITVILTLSANSGSK